jgi:hypothetical protein
MWQQSRTRTSTELSKVEVYDEANGLTTRVQQCGFKSVVGTIWSMAAEDGGNSAEQHFQSFLRRNGEKLFRDDT